MSAPALRRLAASLRRDERGTTFIEFALIAPVLLLLTLGTFQFSMDVYANAVLKGAVQQAGRDSGLESAYRDQAAIDDRVKKQLAAVIPQATTTIVRKNYQSFSQVGRPEDFTDTNRNSVYDNNECFDDLNDNEQWDGDLGSAGQGGARDVVLYTVTMKYNNFVPIGKMFGMKDRRQLSASTTLMNQPFSTQSVRTAQRICPT